MGDLFSDYDVFTAFWVTIKLTLMSAVGAVVLGVVLVTMRVSPIRSLRVFGTAYVNIVRNTPLTLLVLLSSLGLSLQLGLRLASSDSSTFINDQNLRLAVLMLSVYHASFVCEAMRSGVNTVPTGQAEAARAIGLGFGQTLRLVVLPQAIRSSVAPLGNVLIALTKNTTVASVIGVAEASLLMKTMIEDRPDVLFLIFAIFAFGFVVLTLPVGLLFTWLSRRLAVAR